MPYLFEGFELDTDQLELRQNGVIIPIEPQVFAVLRLLLENRDRMVLKDEIVEKVWGGRFVSDSAISSRIKSARRALGDDGKEQRFIRTLHGQGFRFVADVRTIAAPGRVLPTPIGLEKGPPKPADHSRPSIAVLPFRLIGRSELHPAIGDAIAHELIAALSRLRWLFVIARGSSFRFRSDDPDICGIGRLLDAHYCLSGVIETVAGTVTITAELADTRTAGILWGDRFAGRIDDIHEIRARITASIIAALEIQIPLNEAALASVAVPSSLDAWSAYHLGLRHLYRFNASDNAAAVALFERAVALEPGFARASAGLSSAHFQSAFLRYSADPDANVRAARRFAERSVELDPLDPFANFTMGRAFWLTGDVDRSFPWLDRSVSLCPSYAQGFYARAWAETICEHDLNGSENVDIAISLSPLDPFLYAMLATRALTYLIHGDAEQAAAWADRAARSPGAHVMISLIAVIAHSLNKDPERAAGWAADVRSRRGSMSQAHFFASFPFKDGELRRNMARALADNGFY
ncbi:winged helix-turn-helix domain-containing tetratricopeptide repeat protein [Methylobacterium nodulans]|uniref:Transcriptional regulator domain protein n=1 Tax=Methylobacterium nodulans (strain LMG 21967 / CNCM I-2342 / ORS 2060) TaxID=460265 RepID=B8IEI3_METNO|nr:winged helix-turn-helix domain-containing protein [Methylobacterium nodulans]ACL59555.1 transcriptional regulator domain protein [Methylobacterium nodulans ORS 2060]